MKKETIERLHGICAALVSANKSAEVGLEDEIEGLKEALFEISEDRIRSGLFVWSQIDNETCDMERMDTWPTWADGKLVRIGEKAVSFRGPLEIRGIEVSGSGYTLWGYADLGDVDPVTGKHVNTRYVIDQGDSNHSHPVREGEYCDFWPESEEDALAYYGKEVLYRNTGRAHLLGKSEVS